ncbi:hypothetical protein Q5752_004039 [Cryptotrichosporon argae]
MGLSDGVKITLVVLAPTLFFTCFLLLGICLARRRARTRLDPAPCPEAPYPEMPSVGCDNCAAGLAHADAGDGRIVPAAVRRPTISQPHFVEQTVSVLRIGLGTADTRTRVSSVASSLAAPSSRLLPSDASSTGALSEASLTGTLIDSSTLAIMAAANVVDFGERRPSALSAGRGAREAGSVSVRKVSVGGDEEVVVISGPAAPPRSRQPATPSREASTSRLETPPTPAVPEQHPFSARSRSLSLTAAQPAPPLPTSSMSARSPLRKLRKARPDSIVLAKHVPSSIAIAAATASSASASASAHPPTARTATSVQAIKSPAEPASAFSLDTGSPTPALFSAWRGFPPRVSAVDRAVVVSRPTHATGTSVSGQLGMTSGASASTDAADGAPPPAQSPRSAKPSRAGSVITFDTTLPPRARPASSIAVPTQIPVRPARPASTAYTSGSWSSGRSSVPLHVRASEISLAAVGRFPSPPDDRRSSKRASRVTYLSDVVAEEEEQRRASRISLAPPVIPLPEALVQEKRET